jgi:hypothetical protein
MPKIKETLRSICFYKIDPPEADLRRISILEIIFLHYVARSFCETFKLPKELPKIAKCLKMLKEKNETKRCGPLDSECA